MGERGMAQVDIDDEPLTGIIVQVFEIEHELPWVEFGVSIHDAVADGPLDHLFKRRGVVRLRK